MQLGAVVICGLGLLLVVAIFFYLSFPGEQGCCSSDSDLLSYHQCGPVWIPGVVVIRGLGLLSVLFLAPKVFSLGLTGFPPSTKTNMIVI